MSITQADASGGLVRTARTARQCSPSEVFNGGLLACGAKQLVRQVPTYASIFRADLGYDTPQLGVGACRGNLVYPSGFPRCEAV
jgi:hypothetical protein